MPYELEPMEAPRLAGWPLRCMTFLLENPVTGVVLSEYLFEDADAAVVSVCSGLLRAFAEAGATIVEVDIPELGLASAAHSVLITSEMASAHDVTGLPAITFPAGYDISGLPVGLQAFGRPWEEHRLLRLAWVAEGLAPRRKPARYLPLLTAH